MTINSVLVQSHTDAHMRTYAQCIHRKLKTKNHIMLQKKLSTPYPNLNPKIRLSGPKVHTSPPYRRHANVPRCPRHTTPYRCCRLDQLPPPYP